MRIAVCDDHSVFAESLAVLLTRNGHTVTAVTSRPAEAAQALRERPTDICLLDRAFPEGDGVDHVSTLLQAAPDCKILVVSAQIDADTVSRGVANRVCGFARKQQPIAELLRAIERVAAGEFWMPDDLLVATLSMRRSRSRPVPGSAGDACRHFTRREREVLQGIVRGWTTTQLARSMGMTTATVRGHVQGVLSKLGVHSRLKAAVLVVREGIVEADTGEWLLPDTAEQATGL
ncbi:MAG TPA: response regulator transcription factor [Kineosporiaceae bacterium]